MSRRVVNAEKRTDSTQAFQRLRRTQKVDYFRKCHHPRRWQFSESVGGKWWMTISLAWRCAIYSSIVRNSSGSVDQSLNLCHLFNFLFHYLYCSVMIIHSYWNLFLNFLTTLNLVTWFVNRQCSEHNYRSSLKNCFICIDIPNTKFLTRPI